MISPATQHALNQMHRPRRAVAGGSRSWRRWGRQCRQNVLAVAAALALVGQEADAQAKVRVTGLENRSSYDGRAEFFVQIQNEGLRMTPAAAGEPARVVDGISIPLARRSSDRVFVTHDGWPLQFNEMIRQTEPGLHTLKLQVVSMHARELEPQTLLSQEVFASESLPFCDDPAAAAARVSGEE